tara:strand:- start:2588 stop:2800 length:213 start_codon:yes stop_codon:yes gene_type:complete
MNLNKALLKINLKLYINAINEKANIIYRVSRATGVKLKVLKPIKTIKSDIYNLIYFLKTILINATLIESK